MKFLYEILIPTKYGDNGKPIRTRHHKNFDKYVIALTKGLTILSAGKGTWNYQGANYVEKVLPVRIMCDESTKDKIVDFTIKHYRQKAVVVYKISQEVEIRYAK